MSLWIQVPKAALYLWQLSAFQPKAETISAYLKRKNIFIDANKITTDKCKVIVFLNAIGPRSSLRDHVSLMALTDKKNAKLCATLKAYFELKPIVIAERFCFHQRNQGLNKLLAEYITELYTQVGTTLWIW